MQEIKYVILIGSILLKLVVPVQNKGMFDYDKDKLRHFSTTHTTYIFPTLYFDLFSSFFWSLETCKSLQYLVQIIIQPKLRQNSWTCCTLAWVVWAELDKTEFGEALLEGMPDIRERTLVGYREKMHILPSFVAVLNRLACHNRVFAPLKYRKYY